jgi:hypothetical protein
VQRDRSGSTLGTVDRWLDHVFFAGMEVCILTVPVLLLLLSARPPAAVSLSGLAALTASATAIGTYRGGFVGEAGWPRPGHVGTVAGRAAYYGLVLGVATFLGVEGQLLAGHFAPGILLPWSVAFLALAPLPDVLERARALAQSDLDGAT